MTKQQMILSSFLSLWIGAIAQAQITDSTPDHAEIRNVQVQGSGCDMASASVSFSPDLKDLSVLFDNYTVEIGQGTSLGIINGFQKNCQILVDMSVPQGWQFAFVAVDYRGFVALPSSAWAFHRFSSMVPNAPVVSMKEVMHKGPINQDYTFHTAVKPGRETYSPCNQAEQRITLLSQMAVNYLPNTTDRSIAQIAIDSTDLSMKQSFSVLWRRCSIQPNPVPPPPPRPAPGPRPSPRPGPIQPMPRPGR